MEACKSHAATKMSSSTPYKNLHIPRCLSRHSEVHLHIEIGWCVHKVSMGVFTLHRAYHSTAL